MRAILFVNGTLADKAFLHDLLHSDDPAGDDLLIGVDGGTQHCLDIGVVPHIVVGDLDSLARSTVDELAAAGVRFERHPAEKDQTDLELAVECALARGADEILLVAALGDRLDQMLANVLLPAQRAWPATISIVEPGQRTHFLRGPSRLLLNVEIGSTVSVIPLSEAVRGISYSGLRYPLNDATLRLGDTRGISNEAVAQPATVEISEGMLLVVTISPT